MRIRVYSRNGDKPVLIHTQDVKEKDYPNTFAAIEEVITNKVSEIVDNKVISSGITTLYQNDDHFSSYFKIAGYRDDRIVKEDGFIRSIIEGKKRETSEFVWENPAVLERKGKGEVFFGVDVYNPGYVLKTGRTFYNLYGYGNPGYVKGVTQGEVKSQTKANAKHFKDYNAVYTYIEKKKGAFKQMVKENQAHFELEYSCEYFRKDEMERLNNLSEVKSAKATEDYIKLQRLLNEINFVEPKELDEKEEAFIKEGRMIRNLLDQYNSEQCLYYCNPLGEINVEVLPKEVKEVYDKMPYMGFTNNYTLRNEDGVIGMGFSWIIDEEWCRDSLGISMAKAYDVMLKEAIGLEAKYPDCIVYVGEDTDPAGHELLLFVPADKVDEVLKEGILDVYTSIRKEYEPEVPPEETAKTVKLPVTYEVCGFVEVPKGTIEEAIDYFYENIDYIKLPTDTEYVDGSFQLSTDDPEEIEAMANV